MTVKIAELEGKQLDKDQKLRKLKTMLSAKDIKGAMEVFNIKYEGASMEEGTSASGAAEAQQL